MMRDVAFEALAASASASASAASSSSVGSGVDLMPLAMGRYARLTVAAPSRPGKEGTDLEGESSPRELDPLVRVRVRVRVRVGVWVRVRVRVRQPQGARSPEIEARRRRG